MDKLAKVFTVSEITRDIKTVLEQKYQKVQVQGEISGITFASSGHVYFQLKDSGAQISAILFRSIAQKISLAIENGTEIIAIGRISLYEPRGSYQLIITNVSPIGIGELQIRFNELKSKLQQEGLFAKEHKKNLPLFPKNIAVITSLTGAALQDFLSILGRRAPQVNILITASLVQGAQAAGQIIEALKELAKKEVDLIVITRGGGSLEDLWCFNDENLARAIFNYDKPIVSAVGHESDVTICDLVADKRAATPSEAAETIIPNKLDLLNEIDNYKQRLLHSIQKELQLLKQVVYKNANQLKPLLHIIQTYFQKTDELRLRSETAIAALLQSKNNSLWQIISEFKPLNPRLPLEKGYALIKDASGSTLKSSSQINLNEMLKIEMKDGSFNAEVKQIAPKLNTDY